MVCKACGKALENPGGFCPFCGAALETQAPEAAVNDANNAPAPAEAAQEAPAFTQPAENFNGFTPAQAAGAPMAPPPAKKNKKKLFIILAAAAVALLAAIICIVILLVKPHAGKGKKLLPLNLTFGMTYEDFSDKLEKNGYTPPALEDANTNTGYASEGLYIVSAENYQDFDWSFLHSDTLSKNWKTDDRYYESDPALYFSFNENKELYQVVCIFGDLEVAKEFASETEAFLDAFLGTDGKSADGMSASYDTERYDAYFELDGGMERFYYNLIDQQYNTTSLKTKRPTDSELTDMLSKKVQTFSSGFSISIGEAVNNCIKNYDVTILSLAEGKDEMLKNFDQSLIDDYETNFDLNNVYLTIVSGDVILAIDAPYYTEHQEKAVICIFPFDENGNHVEEHDTVILSKEFSSSAQQYMYGSMF